ncbi:MAG: hypothetical protein AAGI22_23120 [Planctomycetota bacterium]
MIPSSATRPLLLACAVGAVGVLAPSCASYNDKARVPIQAFERGNFERAEALFADGVVYRSEFLVGAEAGMSAFAGGDFESALDHLRNAERAVQAAEDRAILGGEALTESMLSFVVNESQKTYTGEGYERVMLHAVLGLAYLSRGRADSVLVEARRVDELLTSEERLYETEYRAGGIGHFLSAIAYELVGKPGEAYIDYQRMYDKGVGGPLVGAALVRLAERLGRDEDLERWRALPGAASMELPPPDWPSVVLVAGIGMAPAKEEVRIDVPTRGGFFSWAVPRFTDGSSSTSHLEIAFPDRGTAVRAFEVEDVAAVARKNLEDRIAWLAVRSAARGLLKREAAKQLKQNEDTAWVGYAFDVFTIATERADLRAWRTLPQRWVAARAFLPPDEAVQMALRTADGRSVDLGTFRLAPGETMFVLGRSLSSGLTAHVVGGERVRASTAAAPSDTTPSVAALAVEPQS